MVWSRPSWATTSRRPGFPGNFLNEGLYTVDVEVCALGALGMPKLVLRRREGGSLLPRPRSRGGRLEQGRLPRPHARRGPAAARVDERAALAVQVVAVVLLHNEDVFAERVIRNVAAFCDRIHVADHMSTDGTWEIVSALARELDHVDATRIANSAQSHDMIAGYAGTNTWVLGADGDELYDPVALQRLRNQLEEGLYDHAFESCRPCSTPSRLIDQAGTATGYLSPPARSAGGKLFNFNAINSWTHVYRQCLHEGEVEYRPGWGGSPSRTSAMSSAGTRARFAACTRASCVVRAEEPDGAVRLNPIEARTHRRDTVGRAQLRLRRLSLRRQPVPWKVEKYRHGPVVTKDVTAFLGAPARS